MTYATRMGSTAEIALVIGEVLTRAGMVVTVCPCHEARDAADYDAVIIGSAVYLRRWDDDAVDYLKRQAPPSPNDRRGSSRVDRAGKARRTSRSRLPARWPR